jgi:F5/8 type C domain
VIGATTTTVTLRSGSTMPVRSHGAAFSLRRGGSLSLPTRRPDLDPTSNLARCRPASAGSEEPGMYAEAAVDGSEATIWAPDAATGSVAVDLGRRAKLRTIAVRFTDVRPASSTVETSLDGSSWTPAPPRDASGRLRNPVDAAFVRVTITRAGDEGTGVRGLVVTE